MDKNLLYRSVDNASDQLIQLSDQIWELAELSMEETGSAEVYVRLLKEQGFTVEECISGIPTAFLGKYGSGKPVIGILGEYDALSSLSQTA